MITAITRFELPEAHSRDSLKQIFLTTAPTYREVPGLIRKYYHVSEDGRMAGAVYIWASRALAEKQYTEDWYRFVSEKYGTRPSVVFFDCPVIVDNLAGVITDD